MTPEFNPATAIRLARKLIEIALAETKIPSDEKIGADARTFLMVAFTGALVSVGEALGFDRKHIVDSVAKFGAEREGGPAVH